LRDRDDLSHGSLQFLGARKCIDEGPNRSNGQERRLQECSPFVAIARLAALVAVVAPHRSQPAVSRRIDLHEPGVPLSNGFMKVPPHHARELVGERWVGFPARRSREALASFLERRLIAAGLEAPEVIPTDSLTA
jgi:hypothetical protein